MFELDSGRFTSTGLTGFPFITPHVSDVMGVIVLTSFVCLSVCLPHSTGRTNGLEFWRGGQVDGYLGQVCRS